ncbi:hypothetical protein PF005_g27895 [Phytophthora fragariae]|uniref:Uncharacterized protein n=2 Tax=Phytophthora TaxID=4783 RepID=A0A6A3SD95_9STRA|nr:hypothetical protein PF003_g18261 [Phytophthora fragariae]KAE9026657.1 hypothetical protein PR002_g10868 [Phytophthora rubi]KAE8921297.1 hypothetical protein PF009_g28420 [Phytophthora fragariae]KAE9012283.1 hypothetical protein PF011_g8977 [Phytophthora fragariae]KAE9032453.1 hypothetical protein PR001_g10605 [Phytophthora rubi]
MLLAPEGFRSLSCCCCCFVLQTRTLCLCHQNSTGICCLSRLTLDDLYEYDGVNMLRDGTSSQETAKC